MSSWRAVGLNYIRYSNIAARVVRQALKPNIKAEAIKREESHVKFTPWKDGKPIKTDSDALKKKASSSV